MVPRGVHPQWLKLLDSNPRESRIVSYRFSTFSKAVSLPTICTQLEAVRSLMVPE
jgi:hypothetical protein